MFQQWRRRRAVERIEPGDGAALGRFRWWQLLGRSLFHIELAGPDGRAVRYSVDVRQWRTDDNGYVKVHLYRDGRRLEGARALPGRGRHDRGRREQLRPQALPLCR